MIKGLDGVRALAFLLIFAFHVELLPCGWVGVQLFFVLSSFLLTPILLETKKKFETKSYFINFYGRRLLRIFPLYFLYLISVWLAGELLSSDKADWREQFQIFHAQLLYALTYTYDFFHATSAFKQSFLLSHLWSLSVEEQFYLIWPCVILLTPTKKLRAVLWIIILSGPLMRGLTIVIHHDWQSKLVIYPLFVYTLPSSHFDAFAIGALVSQIKLSKPRGQLLALTLLVPLIGILTQLINKGSIGSLSEFGYEPFLKYGPYRPIWGYSLLNYYFAVLIYCVTFKGTLRRVLELSIVKYAGKISYGLYVIHLPCIWIVTHLMNGLVPNRWIQYLLVMVITSALASMSYFFVEKPFLSKKNYYFPS